MKRLLVITFLLIGLNSQSQSYKTAIGLRAGETSGLTIKHFMGGDAALEGILGIWSHGFSATLLYEKHAPIKSSGLNFYYGAGGHIAFETYNHSWYYRHGNRYYEHRHGGFGIGIDGIVGIEYKFPIPLAISLDIKPFLEVVSDGGGVWTSLDPGLGLKVAF
jgi:hypothetical protein